MNKRKYNEPLSIDMEFDEALERFIQTDPDEVRGSEDDLVPLSEDESGTKFLIYSTDKGIDVDLRVESGSFWANQSQMAEMFGVTQPTISEHIANIFAEGELQDNEATHRNFRLVREEGKRSVNRNIDHYDLNMLISVGYRVNSKQGTLFRIWATDKLFQILTKRFYIDKERLKNPDNPDVLDELKETIREIRTSTQNVYREVKRLCSLCQDYDGSSKKAREFFMGMENKLLWASTSMTAPEIIFNRADATEPSMGLTYYAGKRGPTQADVKIANNYLAEGESQTKNRATVMWLDYVEDQIDQGRMVTMQEIEDKLDEFIRFNQWPLLRGLGKVTRAAADKHAIAEHKKYKQMLSAA